MTIRIKNEPNGKDKKENALDDLFTKGGARKSFEQEFKKGARDAQPASKRSVRLLWEKVKQLEEKTAALEKQLRKLAKQKRLSFSAQTKQQQGPLTDAQDEEYSR